MIKFSPAAKILLYILLIISVFLTDSFKVFSGILILVFLLALNLPLSVLLKGTVPVTLFVAFAFLSNALFQTGKVVHEVGGIVLTEEGITNGGRLALRLFILILGAKVLTATTSADDLIKGIISLLGPLGKCRPVKEFLSTMSLSIRFLPIIYDEARLLYREAYMNSAEKTFTGRMKLSASLLSAMFEKSIQRAKDMPHKNF